MRSPFPAVSPEELLAHAGWIRGLAGSLLRDPAAADDLAQETWLAVLRRPPPGDRPLRPWLVRLVRNLALQLGRSEACRARRERAAARTESLPTDEELLERAEVHRALVEEVLDLREPYRSTILLHFFEGIRLEEVARLRHIPASTARSHLRRGLEELRARLDARSGGDRGVWVRSMLPMVLPLGGPSASLLGALLMTKKAAAAGFLLVLAAIVATRFLPDSGPASPTDAERIPDEASLLIAAEETAAPAGGREAVRPAIADPGVVQRVQVMVRDAHDGAPIAGADVRLLRWTKGEAEDIPRGPLAEGEVESLRGWECFDRQETEADGRAPLEFDPRLPAQLYVGAPEYFPRRFTVTEWRDLLADAVGGLLLIELERSGSLVVRVADLEGRPVWWAEVQVDPWDEEQRRVVRRTLWPRFSSGLEYIPPDHPDPTLVWSATDKQGVLRVLRLPCGQPLRVRASRRVAPTEGFVTIDPELRAAEIEIRASTGCDLVGCLRYDDGSPAEGHLVELLLPESGPSGFPRDRSREDGTFRFYSLEAGRYAIHVEHPPGIRRVVDVEPPETILEPWVLSRLAPVAGRVLPEDPSLERPIQTYDLLLLRDGQVMDEVRTRGDGVFAGRVAPGPVTIHVMNRHRTLEVLDAEAPVEDLQVRIGAGTLGRLSGAVPGLKKGDELFIRLFPHEPEGTYPAGSSPLCYYFYSGDGDLVVTLMLQGQDFTCLGIQPNRYDVLIEVTGRGADWRRDVLIQSGASTRLEGVMLGFGELRGQVVDAEGRPLPGFEVGMRHPTKEPWRVKTDDRGRFTSGLVPAGPVAVFPHLQGASLLEARCVDVLPGQTEELRLEIESLGGLRGVVRRGGEPAQGARIRMYRPASDGSRRVRMPRDRTETLTDAEGGFRFDDLMPGAYRVAALLAEGEGPDRICTRLVTIRAGATATEEFDFPPANTLLSFTRQGRPVEAITTATAYSATGGQRLLVDEDEPGSLRFACLTGPLLILLRTPETHYVFEPPLPVGHLAAYVDDSLPARPEPYRIELPDGEVQIVSDPGVPPPGIKLESVRGISTVQSGWFHVRLYFEDLPSGIRRVPHVPEGSVLRLEGRDLEGRLLEGRVEYQGPGPLRISWPR